MNLLPNEARKYAYQRYLLRLSTVASLGVAAIMTVWLIALLPTYLLLRSELAFQKHVLAQFEVRSFNGVDAASLGTQINNKLVILGRPVTGPLLSPSDLVLMVTRVGGDGIIIERIAYDEKGSVSLTGSAKDRTTLLGFARALEDEPNTESLVLPVGSLLDEVNNSFTITFIITAEA